MPGGRKDRSGKVPPKFTPLPVHTPKCCQQKLWVKSDRVVWIHVRELDTPIGGYNVDGRYRQLMMLLTRGCFQIDTMIPKLIESRLIDLVRNAEGLRRRHPTVGQKRRSDIVLSLGCPHRRHGVGRDSHPLKTFRFNLRLDIMQLTQLLVAVRSPASPVKHEHRGLLPDSLIQIEFGAVFRS